MSMQGKRSCAGVFLTPCPLLALQWHLLRHCRQLSPPRVQRATSARPRREICRPARAFARWRACDGSCEGTAGAARIAHSASPAARAGAKWPAQNGAVSAGLRSSIESVVPPSQPAGVLTFACRVLTKTCVVPAATAAAEAGIATRRCTARTIGAIAIAIDIDIGGAAPFVRSAAFAAELGCAAFFFLEVVVVQGDLQ